MKTMSESHKRFSKQFSFLLIGVLAVLLPSLAFGLTGDFDNDGDVDRNDVTILLTEIRSPGPHDLKFDLNGDGAVNRADARTILGFCTLPRCAIPPTNSNDVDDDKDGFTENEGDCDDTNPAINPDAVDIPGNGIDEDCDGQDATPDPNDVDNDEDGFTENGGDCDDTNPAINPDAVDIPDNGIDENCDGVDEKVPQIGITTPSDLSRFNNSPLTVSGTINEDAATVEVNGIPATVSAGIFTAEVPLTEGNNTLTATATDPAGNVATASIQVTLIPLPTVAITDPLNQSLFTASPITVTGTVGEGTTSVEINGVPGTLGNQTWTVTVPLQEGTNTLTAVARNASGNAGTASVQVNLDTTSPTVVIESPVDGFVTSNPTIDVAGMINDITVGTVNSDNARVSVNGVEASVANRSFFARAIPLLEGMNTITAMGEDEVGNVGMAMITVERIVPTGNRIELVSGQDQRAGIQQELAGPLTVRLLNGTGNPVAGKNVVFRVILGDGKVGVGTPDEARGVVAVTNASGLASTRFRLGTRAGSGIHRVRAKAVEFEGEVVFFASADPNPGDKINVVEGNSQRGVANQPLPQPLIVAVTDVGANLIPNAQVEFKVTKGSGIFQNGQTVFSTTTDTDGRANAQLTLGPETGLDVHRVAATLVGTTAFAGFTASGFVAGNPADTSISGVVLDNQDNPVPGVTLRLEGTNLQTVADAQGQFQIVGVSVGTVHLIADGSTATVPGEWPTLTYEFVTVAGVENTLPAPIYLLPLDMDNAKTVGLQDVEFTLPEVPGFQLTVKAGSVTFPDGSTVGQISVTPVNANKIPMPPPNGMQPQFIVTIQPAGTIFDPPAPLTLPNVDGHAPGAQVEMFSFDHDLEAFVTIGLGTVSADGSVIESNLGVGVIKAGWHCGSQPGGSGCLHDCPQCTTCATPECTCTIPEPGSCDDGNPCTLEDTCSEGSCQPGQQAQDDLICDGGGDGCVVFACEDGGCVQVFSFINGTPCNDDGNQCTSDVCQEGVCVHTSNPCRAV